MTPHGPRARSRSRLRRAVATVGLTSALLVSSVGVADAEVWSTTDAAGDVRSYHVETEEEGVAPEQAAGDVRRFAVSHTARHVTLRLTMRKKLPKQDWMVFERIRTPRAAFDLTVFRFSFGGGVSFTKANGFKEQRCRGISVKYDANAIQIAVPRRCIGNPSVVRIGAGVSTQDSERFYADDALRSAVGAYLKLSPPVRRG